MVIRKATLEILAHTTVLVITIFLVVTNTEDKIVGFFFGFCLGFLLGGIPFLTIDRWFPNSLLLFEQGKQMTFKQMVKDVLSLSLAIFILMIVMYIWYREKLALVMQYPMAILLFIVACVIVRALFSISKK